MKLEIWHCPQPDGTWVATCESVAGWFCFGDTLAETRDRAEASLVSFVEQADFNHFEVMPLQVAA